MWKSLEERNLAIIETVMNELGVSDIEELPAKVHELVESRRTQREPDACPVCFGDQYLLHNDGLMRPCPACNGTGKRR